MDQYGEKLLLLKNQAKEYYNFIIPFIVLNMVVSWNVSLFPFNLSFNIDFITSLFAIVLLLYLNFVDNYGSKKVQNKKIFVAFAIIVSAFFISNLFSIITDTLNLQFPSYTSSPLSYTRYGFFSYVTLSEILSLLLAIVLLFGWYFEQLDKKTLNLCFNCGNPLSNDNTCNYCSEDEINSEKAKEFTTINENSIILLDKKVKAFIIRLTVFLIIFNVFLPFVNILKFLVIIFLTFPLNILHLNLNSGFDWIYLIISIFIDLMILLFIFRSGLHIKHMISSSFKPLNQFTTEDLRAQDLRIQTNQPKKLMPLKISNYHQLRKPNAFPLEKIFHRRNGKLTLTYILAVFLIINGLVLFQSMQAPSNNFSMTSNSELTIFSHSGKYVFVDVNINIKSLDGSASLKYDDWDVIAHQPLHLGANHFRMQTNRLNIDFTNGQYLQGAFKVTIVGYDYDILTLFIFPIFMVLIGILSYLITREKLQHLGPFVYYSFVSMNLFILLVPFTASDTGFLPIDLLITGLFYIIICFGYVLLLVWLLKRLIPKLLNLLPLIFNLVGMLLITFSSLLFANSGLIMLSITFGGIMTLFFSFYLVLFGAIILYYSTGFREQIAEYQNSMQ